MAKGKSASILIYSLPFIVGGILIYSYFKRRKKLREEAEKPTTSTENTETKETPVSGEFKNQYFVTTSSGNLNVRKKPSTSSAIVGSLARGTKVFGRQSSITGWIEVSKDGRTSLGFASSQFLSVERPSQSTGTFAPSTSGFQDVGRPTGVSRPNIPAADTTSGNLGVGRPTGTSQLQFSKFKVVVSSGSNLNIRKEPSSTGQILEKAARNTILLARQSSSSNWMEISKDGRSVFGYAAKNYLSPVL